MSRRRLHRQLGRREHLGRTPGQAGTRAAVDLTGEDEHRGGDAGERGACRVRGVGAVRPVAVPRFVVGLVLLAVGVGAGGAVPTAVENGRNTGSKSPVPDSQDSNAGNASANQGSDARSRAAASRSSAVAGRPSAHGVAVMSASRPSRSGYRAAYSRARLPPAECASTSIRSRPRWRRSASTSSTSRSQR
ncbi:hypothetical protein HDA41_007780 [Streptomyces caelestis]|uniref:Uncharacterized protein n=1 Tax=Streptomyces caelestis TaxID=36816 RepID=A0A7W9HD83_9ACTN|nr:hypothetical protein [Streptomyces caelestis]